MGLGHLAKCQLDFSHLWMAYWLAKVFISRERTWQANRDLRESVLTLSDPRKASGCWLHTAYVFVVAGPLSPTPIRAERRTWKPTLGRRRACGESLQDGEDNAAAKLKICEQKPDSTHSRWLQSPPRYTPNDIALLLSLGPLHAPSHVLLEIRCISTSPASTPTPRRASRWVECSQLGISETRELTSKEVPAQRR
ncbi:hypothetical protein BDY21DRAFT_366934 [Lineolata rhizophorae]|uniref:Uncharacterized protein n=1 Tax=Lineolata rhizophorae TaxID=578093 RepID=A0A6A6NPF0_9PEZI|nr:hypothetical protein BDY21DRAFT_366934 [Lineolata rhizophorae]